MPRISLPMEGECRCGQLRFRIDALPLLTMACHCTGCQRMSASAFSLSAAIPPAGFALTRGEPVIGGLRGSIKHYCCPQCMSWVFTRPDVKIPFVNVRPTMLEDCSWYAPFIETYTCEKLWWAATPAVHSYERFPSFETFESLVKEYAAQAGEG